jgi:hypothetical protein
MGGHLEDQVEAIANLLVEQGTIPGDLVHSTLDSMESA